VPSVTAETRAAAVHQDFEIHRGELTAFCYRMLGSAFEAEDAVQETLIRAWRAFDRFEGRSSIRTWLYKIAGNVCFDMLRSRKRRAMPMDLGGPGSVEGPMAPPLAEQVWVEPMPDALAGIEGADPAVQAVIRDSIRLALIVALQHLPPRQRAVLILRDVLAWKAKEVADLLDSSVASVNSALQRARATLGELGLEEAVDQPGPIPDQELLDRYVDAFERYDLEALTDLVAEDARQSMPPYPLWLEGRDDIFAWWVGPGAGCRGSRLVPTVANGRPALAQYRPSGPGGRHEPWSLQMLEVRDEKIVEFTMFLETGRLFPLFGLPPTLS
jgi:RNA polymerase sigma-70 factor, ECF subfamily